MAIAMVASMGASIVFTTDEVRLRLNWMYYGSHAGFAYGKDKGLYKAAGIDLDIRSGNGSSSAHRLVANKDSHFAYGSCAAKPIEMRSACKYSGGLTSGDSRYWFSASTINSAALGEL